jgi:hypothetical protein
VHKVNLHANKRKGSRQDSHSSSTIIVYVVINHAFRVQIEDPLISIFSRCNRGSVFSGHKSLIALNKCIMFMKLKSLLTNKYDFFKIRYKNDVKNIFTFVKILLLYIKKTKTYTFYVKLFVCYREKNRM